MKTKLLTLALAGVITLAGTFSTAASPKASPTPDAADTVPNPAPSRPLPFNGKIYAVDAVAKTFSTQNKQKKIRVFAITPETRLTGKNAAATFEDLKIGEEVRGMATPQGDGKFETQSVIIGAREELKPVPTAAPATGPGPTPKPSKKSRATPTPAPAATKRTD